EASTNLRRGARSDERASGPWVDAPGDLSASAVWTLHGDLGRRYAAVSGDINPIHLYALGARLFGFRAAIAHGMWTKARCLAVLTNRLPAAFRVEVPSGGAIALPGRVEFLEDAGTGRFGVRDARTHKPRLDGRVAAS